MTFGSHAGDLQAHEFDELGLSRASVWFGWVGLGLGPVSLTGWIRHSMIQQQIVFNVNYGPWSSGAFMLQKPEAMSEALRLLPDADIAHLPLSDGPHVDTADGRLQAHINFMQKGPVAKLSGPP